MRVVEFIKSCPPYNPGESAGFDDAEAARLVARGTARFTDEPIVIATAEADVREAGAATQLGGRPEGAADTAETVAADESAAGEATADATSTGKSKKK